MDLFPTIGLLDSFSGGAGDSARANASAASNLSGGGQSVNIGGNSSVAWIALAAAAVGIVYILRRS